MRVGGGAAILICNQTVEFVRVVDGPAIVNCSHGDLDCVMSSPVMSCHVMSRHVTSRHVMSFHVISCHVTCVARRVLSRLCPSRVSCHVVDTTQIHAAHVLTTRTHTTHTRTTHTPTTHSHTARLMRSHRFVLHPRLPAFRLPTHVLHLNFRCGVIRSYSWTMLLCSDTV